MKKRKRLSGFTLLELVVVMAIFSAIAVGALAMIRPAMQLFHKTSAQEGAAADIDNISRYIQDNLRYADRVNIYYGYGEIDVDSMISKNISDKYKHLIQNGSEWKSDYYTATPLEYFRDYYFGADTNSYKGKNVNVMEITPDCHVNIYTYSLEDFADAGTMAINSDFYSGDHVIQITDWDFSSPNLTLSLKINYNGVTRGNDGKRTNLKQESKISLTFLNVAQRSEYTVIERAILGDDESYVSSDDENSQNGNVINSRPASAYKLFKPDTLPDDPGNTYIVYTVPEIIIP